MQWLKLHRGFSSDPILGLVAHKLELPRATINAVALDLLEYAGTKTPRGSIVGYDVEAAAFNLGLSESVVKAVMEGLRAKGKTDGARWTEWEEFQKVDRTNAERQKRHRQKAKGESNAEVTDGNALHNTDEKDRKTESEKEKKEKAPPFELPSWVPAEAWAQYNEMRNRKKKPMTRKAKEMAVNKLHAFAKRGIDIKAVLEQSVFHAWDGLFEPKGVNNGNSQNSAGSAGKSERARAAIVGDAQRRGDIEGQR